MLEEKPGRKTPKEHSYARLSRQRIPPAPDGGRRLRQPTKHPGHSNSARSATTKLHSNRATIHLPDGSPRGGVPTDDILTRKRCGPWDSIGAQPPDRTKSFQGKMPSMPLTAKSYKEKMECQARGTKKVKISLFRYSITAWKKINLYIYYRILL